MFCHACGMGIEGIVSNKLASAGKIPASRRRVVGNCDIKQALNEQHGQRGA
jgi:hypothetical protein